MDVSNSSSSQKSDWTEDEDLYLRVMQEEPLQGTFCRFILPGADPFWEGQFYVCSSAVAQFNFEFSHYNFFQLLKSWSICVKKYIYAPIMAFITVLWFISHKGEIWRLLLGSSQFSKSFCFLLLLLFHILVSFFFQNPIVQSVCKVSSVEMSISVTHLIVIWSLLSADFITKQVKRNKSSF